MQQQQLIVVMVMPEWNRWRLDGRNSKQADIATNGDVVHDVFSSSPYGPPYNGLDPSCFF